MNYASLLFLGVFFSFACSWCGMVLIPQFQLGRQEAVMVESTGQLYPTPRNGLAAQGKEIYRQQGCVECHTQQVRDSDVPKWGPRITVAQDYLRDQPVLPGSQRVGPDLANIGLRKPDAKWHLQHLYSPQSVEAKSSMPPYRYLFEKRKIKGEKSANALALPKEFPLTPGFEIVPKHEAEALVAYLMSLRANVPLFEAPYAEPKPKAPEQPAAGATNTPAADTNAPVK
jgi:cytochrome c oxidase cbb3-type subunit II